MNRIVKATAKDNYQLWVKFDDGCEGIVNLGELVGKGVFKIWEDEAVFKQVQIDPVSKTVSWMNGKIDLDPDVLYSDVLKKTA